MLAAFPIRDKWTKTCWYVQKLTEKSKIYKTCKVPTHSTLRNTELLHLLLSFTGYPTIPEWSPNAHITVFTRYTLWRGCAREIHVWSDGCHGPRLQSCGTTLYLKHTHPACRRPHSVYGILFLTSSCDVGARNRNMNKSLTRNYIFYLVISQA